jgi:hypothetical protein
MSRTLILLGLLLIAVGLLWPWIGWLGLGHLPGDIVVERKNFTLYVPIATGLLISVVVTVLLWLVNWGGCVSELDNGDLQLWCAPSLVCAPSLCRGSSLVQRGAESGPLESPHDLFKAPPLGCCPNLGMGMAKSTDEC